MADNRVFNNGANAFEGTGSAFSSPVQPIVERCGSNPFGSTVRDQMIEVLQNWLAASEHSRYTPGALHTLKEAVSGRSPAQIRRAIKETFCRSDQVALRQGLIACGAAREKASLNESRAPAEEKAKETAEDLLREAVIHVPQYENELRARIEAFLLRS